MNNPTRRIPRTFVSIVGRTAMGTLAPLLATRQNLGDPVAIHLLATDSVHANTHKLVEYLKNHQGFTMPIQVWPIADSLRDRAILEQNRDNEAGSPLYEDVRQIIRKLEQTGPMTLNIQGGTNFLYAGVLLELQSNEHAHIQTGHTHTTVTLHNGTRYEDHTFPLPEPLSVEEIFSHQEMQWEIADAPENLPLSAAMKQAGVAMPANSLRNVRIGEFIFDLVWNEGNNVLNFLAWARNSAHRVEDKVLLQEGRAWLDFAKDKRHMGFLFTRNIYLFHWNGNLCERVNIESGAKIHAYHTGKPHYTREAFKKVFTKKQDLPVDTLPRIKDCPPEGTPVLITSQGTSDATLAALCAHNATCMHALLVFTPGEDRVESRKDKILHYQKTLGFESIIPVETTHAGTDLIRRLPAHLGKSASVNITPGTKGQTFALAIWAKQNKAEAYAFEPDKKGKSQLFSYTTGKTTGIAPVPIETQLNIMLESPLKNCSEVNVSAEPEADNLDATLRFLKSAAQNDKNIDLGRPYGKLLVPGFTLERKSGSPEWTLCWSASPQSADTRGYAFTTEKGVWFEKLVAWAFATLPKNLSVAMNVTTQRPGGAEDTHLTEVDILALGKGECYAVSCKSPKLNEENTGEAASEIRSVAHNFGRYFAPMLCSFYQEKVAVVEGVVTFGWRTLGNQNELAAAMNQAKSLLR